MPVSPRRAGGAWRLFEIRNRMRWPRRRRRVDGSHDRDAVRPRSPADRRAYHSIPTAPASGARRSRFFSSGRVMRRSRSSARPRPRLAGAMAWREYLKPHGALYQPPRRRTTSWRGTAAWCRRRADKSIGVIGPPARRLREAADDDSIRVRREASRTRALRDGRHAGAARASPTR